MDTTAKYSDNRAYLQNPFVFSLFLLLLKQIYTFIKSHIQNLSAINRISIRLWFIGVHVKVSDWLKVDMKLIQHIHQMNYVTKILNV